MVSSFTTNKRIEQPANGDYPGNWNVPINNDWAILDAALGGQTNLNATGASGTVVLSSTQYQPLIINISGVLTADVNYQIPSPVGGQWNVNNSTTGAFAVTISSGGGGLSTVVGQGFITQVYSDGTNIQPTNTSAAIPNNSVTNSKLSQMPGLTIKSNITGGTANANDNTLSAILDTITTTQGAILYRDVSTWASLAPGIVGQMLQTGGSGANPSWAAGDVPVRQTVLSGPATNGLPTFLPATSVTLTLTTQNVGTGANSLVVTAANGFGAGGDVDVIGIATANLSWSLAPSATNFLMTTVSAGALTASISTLPIIYQYGGALSTTNGQYTFDIVGKQMYLGNGSVANPISTVCVGEAVTSGSGVTSTIAYAYEGYYDSGYITPLPTTTATVVSKNSNLGVDGALVQLTAKNLTADLNYSVGDINSSPMMQPTSGLVVPMPVSSTRNTVWFTTGGFAAWVIINKNTGVNAGPAVASWGYRLTAKRPW
ncbi:hypothetical protein GCM10007874_17490 [Labrys miyagiensis]|uniref:Uncharacterized protein n=1 Tax=Labrys miyagiensis TaxID=346912 RepID=A0ABQ6CKD6_9HYPH|nr:hypothetical protein [Labrys miyagiensis]GLS18732.1 hypothetical protein GCM10007874_17490 [Labrys miyagiensis]